MKATALQFPDNSTQAHFATWAWGNGTWPTPTTYGFSSFLYNAGFIQTGNTSTFAGTLEIHNIIGDGQAVFNNITFNVTSTASSGTTATYGFSGLSGQAIRVGQYLASISGTLNGSGAFNLVIPTTIVTVTSVTYTSSTSGSFTTSWAGGTFTSTGETGTGQINATATTFFLTSAQTLPANNASVGSTASAAYGNTTTGQTTFKGYWQSGTSYVVGDVVIWVSNASTGTSATLGTFLCILATSSASPPTTNAPNTNWQQNNYEVWETGDSALPTYVQSNQSTASVTFNPVPFLSPNTAGNLLVVFGRFTGGSGAPTIKDTNNNTWTQIISNTNGSDINVIWVAYSVEGTTTTNYVTVTQPTQNTLQIAIAEYSGVTSVAPQLDQDTSSTGTSTSASSGNVTTTVANELILGFVDNATSNGLTVTPTNSFTARQTVNGNLVLMDKTVTATGTYAATATLSSSVAWFAAIVTLKGTQLPPFYFKFEYGNIGTNTPAIGFQIGTSITTTGALAQSGLRSFREIIGYSSATASSGTSFETDFYADGTPGLTGGKFAMIAFRTGTNQQWFLGWERSHDNFGVDTGLYMTYVIGLNPNSAWRQSSVFATGGTNFSVRTTGNAMGVDMGNNVSLQTGNFIPTTPIFPSVGYFGNPMTVLLGLAVQDTSEGSVFVATVYGGSHNYLMTKQSWANYLVSSSANSGLAIRWE